MLKMIPACICDLCGKTERARTLPGRYNEHTLIIPEGWMVSEVNKEVHICPECIKKLKAIGRHG